MASSGGSVFPPALMHVFQQRLPNVMLSNGYGMTETCGVGTIASGQLLLAHPECVGRPWPTAEVEIRGTDGEALGAGEVGEIAIRTASVFLGYWNDLVATQAAIDREGWYHTGDFGAIRDGTLQLESRMRDLVIRGGENIYPPEIENRLIEHEDVVDCAVIGVQHHLLGQEVKAFVVRRDGSNPSVEDLRRWVGDALAPFKVPALIEFRPSLPYTETGKVIKHALE
jgi:acyl-CoA synthetase (AMP-forming)/AMP-acid ligase II